MNKLVAIGSCMGAPHYFRGLGLALTIVNSLEGAEDIVDDKTVIMYGGGEDISPSLYNSPKNQHTYAPDKPSRRDALEASIFKLGQERGAAHYGICRGHQLLAAMAGGRLFQHVHSHHTSHPSHLTPDGLGILPNDNPVMMVTSVHHQAVDMEYLKSQVKDAVAILENDPISPVYHLGPGEVLKPGEVKADNEAFLIPSMRIFGVQGHPEFDSPQSPFVNFCRKMMTHLVEETHAN